MVPEATFTSYYGRPVVKPSPWENDIPAYLFLGGLAAGSSLLGAGADLTGRPALRTTGRIGALAGISLSMVALVHDLGKPSRFVNMLRVAKPTSPMSVGTWILTAYGTAGRGGGDRRAGRPRRGAAAAAAACRPGCSPRRAARPGWAQASWHRRWRPTPRCSCPTRPRRRGTRPTASCRSSSSARRPLPPGASA